MATVLVAILTILAGLSLGTTFLVTLIITIILNVAIQALSMAGVSGFSTVFSTQAVSAAGVLEPTLSFGVINDVMKDVNDALGTTLGAQGVVQLVRGVTSTTATAPTPISQVLATSAALALSIDGAFIDFANDGGINNRCITAVSTVFGVAGAFISVYQLLKPGTQPLNPNMLVLNSISLGLGIDTTLTGAEAWPTEGAC